MQVPGTYRAKKNCPHQQDECEVSCMATNSFAVSICCVMMQLPGSDGMRKYTRKQDDHEVRSSSCVLPACKLYTH